MSHCRTNNNHNRANSKKSFWIIAGLGAFVLLLGAGLFFASSPAPANPPASAAVKNSLLAASESFFDFGTISMAKGKVSKPYKIKNSTSQSIAVTKLYTSCMCTTASIQGNDKKFGPFGMPSHGGITPISLELAPGREAEVTATFDPAAHGPAGVGQIARQVFVETSDGGKLTLDFRANVTP